MAQHESRTTGSELPGQTLWTSSATGVIACIWYSLPDYVPSKRRRTLIKAVLLVPAGVYGARLGREGIADGSEDAQHGSVVPGLPCDNVRGDQPAQSQPARHRGSHPAAQADAWWDRVPPGAQLGIVVGMITVLTAGSIAAERAIYRIGEELARRGVSRPHTKLGLVLGALVPLVAVARTIGPA